MFEFPSKECACTLDGLLFVVSPSPMGAEGTGELQRGYRKKTALASPTFMCIGITWEILLILQVWVGA